MGAFGIPLSGLVASQDALQTISNNLANLNTVGYKDETTSFADLFAQSSALNGANDPVQGGIGVRASQTSSNFTDGAPTSTGLASNMALAGNGFFVVKQSSGAVDYSRAGNFTANTSGLLVDPNGDLVMGYQAVNGVVTPSSTVGPLQVGTASLPATATTAFNFNANLDSASATGATFSSTTPIYDSLGDPHELTVNYTNLGNNSWSYSVNLPAADLAGGSTTPLATGTLNFDTAGKLVSTTSGTSTTPVPLGTSSSIAVTCSNLADGAAPLNIAWNLADSSGNPTVSQTAVASGTPSTTQNGFAAGVMTDYTIQSNGVIEGTFSNGQLSAIGQVALANFANVQGLAQIGGNLYQETTGSGIAQLGVGGQGGLGTITDDAVEGSNVDVATEFSKMIVAQQAYQANAKTVTTMDSLIQTTMQMIQQ